MRAQTRERGPPSALADIFAKAIKDLTERVKVVEEKQKAGEDKEIKEIVETQRIIDEILVSNADVIKR